MGYIYLITNLINNKKYIGKTSRKPNLRWNEHKCNAFYENYNFPLYKAMKKYGIENFKFEVIEDNIPLKELNKREEYWINYYNTYNGAGYNATKGGDGISFYDYQEISKKYLELKNINLTAKFFKCDHGTVIEALKTCNIDTGYRKKVYQIDKQTNEIINEFDSINEAARQVFNDVEKSKNISSACRQKIKSAYGYKWAYKIEQ